MAIGKGLTSTVNFGTRTNTLVSAPSGWVAGDVLTVGIGIGGSTSTTITPPAGWQQMGTAAVYTATDPWWVSVSLWVLPYDGNSSWTWTHASRSSQAFCQRWTGVDTSNPQDATGTSASSGAGNVPGGAVAPGLTVATAGAQGVIARGSWDGNPISPPAGWTENYDQPVLWMGDRNWAAAGPTGNVTVADGNSGLSKWGIVMGVLRPAPAAAPAFSGWGVPI